ncbi:MAG TPA: hypothetical protein VNV88_05285 [Candidatus Solibacter sp.]|jgi:hypothetical protein|nr:hypothetical protein [Candidatus Solibacter sp.]
MLSHQSPSWAVFRSLLRDIFLSFCPIAVRRSHPPESTERTLAAAKITGLLQALVFAVLSVFHYAAFMLLRAHQLGRVLGGAAEAVQGAAMILLTFDFLIHPGSLLLLYFLVEGVLRFLGGVFFEEIVPSLPVFVAFKIMSHRRAEAPTEIPDTFENLQDGERIRIASAHPKSGWNTTITIDIGGQWYEIEKEEIGTPPRAYIYLLRPAPAGKILRKYEQYMPPVIPHGTAAEEIRVVTEVPNA